MVINIALITAARKRASAAKSVVFTRGEGDGIPTAVKRA